MTCCSLITAMEEKKRKKTIIDLIQETRGTIIKKVELNEFNGNLVYIYGLIFNDQDQGVRREFYFSQEIDDKGNSLWYGRVVCGEGYIRNSLHGKMFKKVLSKKNAKTGYLAMKAKYEQLYENLIHEKESIIREKEPNRRKKSKEEEKN